MRNIALAVILLIYANTKVLAQVKTYKIAEKTAIELKSSVDDTHIVAFTLSGFTTQTKVMPTGNAISISAPLGTPMLIKDAPDLIKYSFSLSIPDDKDMKLRIISSDYTEYFGLNIIPSKGNLYRDTNPDELPYEFGADYNKDQFFPGRLTAANTPYILRDHRGQSFHIFPFQYNPVKKILRIYHKMEIEVKSKDGVANNNIFSKTRTHFSTVREFNEIYKNRFLNYGKEVATKYVPLEEHGSMLIISHGPFMNAMQPFVDWKNTIGIPTTIVDVASIGNTAASIKSYIQNVYDTTNLVFVLLVGDALQVPTNIVNSYHSDNAYGYLSGNDSYPEIFVGRFSAENIDHVSTQVERSINYELTPSLQQNLFNRAMGIASQEGPGHDNLYDHEHVRRIRDSLLNYSYVYVSELYEGTQGGLDAPGDPTQAQVSAELNTGAGLVNYTGHGWDQGWGTSGFSNVEVNALINTKILPFIWSVACVNGDFVGTTCFAEAFLRATHNNEPSGAVAAFMSTINQSWNPPMSGQLEMNNLLTESFTNNIKRTFGGLSINGCMKMNDDYGTGGAEMTDTWTIFGDPSLMVRTDNPVALTVNHNSAVLIGESTLTVNCGTDGAYVCLTINNQIISTGVVIGGSALLNFAPLSTIDTITVAVTAYNHIPYLGEVLIIPPTGPYVIYDASVINDAAGNNNGQADYNENITLNMMLKNVGINNADSVWAVLSTSSPYLTINNNQNLWGNILTGQQLNLNNAFSLTVTSNTPNNYSNMMSLAVNDNNGNTWNSSFVLKTYAPQFVAGSLTLDDSAENNNGILDPGETIIIGINVTNTGLAGISNVTGSITSTNPYITINNGTHNFSNFIAGSTQQALFVISADAQTPLETLADIVFTVNAGHYTITQNYSLNIGVLPEFWMKDTSIYICDAYFYDSKGPGANYENSENKAMTFYPLQSYPINEAHLSVTFIEFDVEENEWTGGCWDEMFIYNGPSTSSPLIGSYCGTNWPPAITSTHPSGALTFKFTSDEYVDMGGWKARFTCIVTSSVNEANKTSHLNVFPNPASDKIYLEFINPEKIIDLKVLNTLGDIVVYAKVDNISEASNTMELDVSSLKAGIYFIEISGLQTRLHKKILLLK